MTQTGRRPDSSRVRLGFAARVVIFSILLVALTVELSSWLVYRSSSQRAMRLAAQTQGLAERSGEVMDRTIAAMAETGLSSRKIEEITNGVGCGFINPLAV